MFIHFLSLEFCSPMFTYTQYFSKPQIKVSKEVTYNVNIILSLY